MVLCAVEMCNFESIDFFASLLVVRLEALSQARIERVRLRHQNA